LEKIRIKSKVILLGDGAVGKTSLIRRYVLDQFKDDYIQTIGTKVTKKDVSFQGPNEQIVELTFMIWDIMGQKEFYREHISQFSRYKPQQKYYLGARGAFIVCDMTNSSSIENLPLWIQSITEEVGTVPLIFLANKCDLADQIKVDYSKVEAIANHYKSPHLKTSAKTGQNVEKAFEMLGRLMVNDAI
jgi:small GTP-binding protein